MGALMVSRRLFGVGLVAIVAVAGLGWYAYRSVPVSVGTIRRCSDSRHQGNPVLHEDVRTENVPFIHKEQYKITTESVVCEPCTARNRREQEEAEARRRQQEREEQVRREAQAIFDALEITCLPNEALTLAPGDSLGEVSVRIKNRGSQIVDLGDVRFLLDSREYVDIADRSAGRMPHLRTMKLRRLGEFATKGLPIRRWKPTSAKVDAKGLTTLAPKDDPHYEDSAKELRASSYDVEFPASDWKTVLRQQEQAGILFGYLSGTLRDGLALALSPKAPAGTDITIGTSIMVRGVKYPVNSVTVHVKADL